MSLIPVGLHRGKVIVWDQSYVHVDAAPFVPGVFWNLQRYAIVDPTPATGAKRFFNYYLPVEEVPTGPLVPTTFQDLFCSGHAWSPFGYLVVAGGTGYVGGLFGGKLVFEFDPRFPNQAFEGTNMTMYPVIPGSPPPALGVPGTCWHKEQFTLQEFRFYPTVTLTHRLPRAFNPLVPSSVEAMLVLGGSDLSNSPSPGGNELNSYEALLLVDTTTALGQRCFRDEINPTAPTPIREWWGPGHAMGSQYVDWLFEYPRCHFLSNGNVFLSGYVAPSAQIDHSVLTNPTTSPVPVSTTPSPTWPQNWNTSAGMSGPASQFRNEGSSVYFARIGTFQDLVVRIGGADIALTAVTASCEACFATQTGNWFSVPSLNHARHHANAVVLPDGSILLIGGNDAVGSVMIPELYRWGGGGWMDMTPQTGPNPSPRSYHATAVLLPNGSVMVGGG
ncbi:MAG: hypothetical protein ABIP94_13145, partial [Planctomycetota bacterium]